jgi:hypothetical protein
VGHLDVEALVPKGRGEQVGDVLLIVDDEDPGLFCGGSMLLHGVILGPDPVRML